MPASKIQARLLNLIPIYSFPLLLLLCVCVLDLGGGRCVIYCCLIIDTLTCWIFLFSVGGEKGLEEPEVGKAIHIYKLGVFETS